MALNDAFPTLRLADSATVEPPIRIILHIQPDVGMFRNLKLDERRVQIANAFFEYKGLESTRVYVHLPSAQERWESQVTLDYCTGCIPEGSVADQIPFCVYLVSQQKDQQQLTFEKAKTTRLTYLNAQIATETFPWKSETFCEHAAGTEQPKESDSQHKGQLANQDRRKTRSDFLQRIQREVSEVEAKLRRNIEGCEPELSPENNPSLPPNNPATGTSSSISNISYLLHDQAIRVLLQISTENLTGNLRERCTIASKTFAQLMLRNEYPTTKVYRLIRGMDPSPGDREFWVLVDYWIGRSKGTRNPPFLSMSYRGHIQNGLMKFQPTKLSNSAAQIGSSVFLMKFHLNRTGSSVTVEGVEPTGEPLSAAREPQKEIPAVPEAGGEQIFNLAGISGIPGGSDGVVSGDWVVPNYESTNGMSSWEFVGDA